MAASERLRRGPVTSRPLVSTEWLAEHLDDPNVRVVDCRWYLRPFDDRCGDDEYRKGHVPGAVHLRWDTELADPDRAASMLAPPQRFAAAMRAAGIGDDTFVVTYDDHHVPVAARVWWALRVYGHDDVAVLDGGITAWRREGRPLSNETPTFAPATFTLACAGPLRDEARRARRGAVRVGSTPRRPDGQGVRQASGHIPALDG
jgi:thiosulfate/3-mercaptopyruvate sulfurtransferase